MSAPLSTDVKVYQQLKERLMRDFCLGEDDQALIDTLDGLSDLKERIAILARRANERKYLAAGLKALIEEQKARMKRLEEGEEKLRELVAWAMQEAGIDKITAPDMTISQRIGVPPLIVDPIDPEAFKNSDFVRTVTTYSWDKDVIKRVLQEGAFLPFAHFGNARPQLTIRTK